MQQNHDAISGVALRRNIPSEARAVLETQTKGLKAVGFYYPDKETILSVAKDDSGAYHVTAVFVLGGRWVHSFDAQGVSADVAFGVLSRRVMS